MKWSLKLGTFAGIGVYVHATFVLLLGFFAWSFWVEGRSALAVVNGISFILAVFTCVVLHEFGHALTARRYGIRTRDHKLIFFYGLPLDARGAVARPTTPGWELYDLRSDPYELRNVYAEPAYAEIVRKLKDELLELKQRVGDTDEKYPALMKVREANWQ